jgi:hypothetical protein
MQKHPLYQALALGHNAWLLQSAHVLCMLHGSSEVNGQSLLHQASNPDADNGCLLQLC